jgi:hypothetical protein
VQKSPKSSGSKSKPSMKQAEVDIRPSKSLIQLWATSSSASLILAEYSHSIYILFIIWLAFCKDFIPCRDNYYYYYYIFFLCVWRTHCLNMGSVYIKYVDHEVLPITMFVTVGLQTMKNKKTWIRLPGRQIIDEKIILKCILQNWSVNV